MEERIAKIKSTFLGIEDHGCFVAGLELDYGNDSGQNTGLHILEGLKRTISACGVETWEQIRGRTVIALIGDNKMVKGIKPLPTESGKQFIFTDAYMERG